MLSRIENADVEFRLSPWGKKGRVWLHLPKVSYRSTNRVTEEEFTEGYRKQWEWPRFLLEDPSGRVYWWFRNRFYSENEHLSDNQVYALLVSKQQQKQQKLDRAEAMIAMGEVPLQRRREHIFDDVKQLVWVRDGGHCVSCGRADDLQYDHIIPVSWGGSSAPENLQLLCGPCNRRKSDGLKMR